VVLVFIPPLVSVSAACCQMAQTGVSHGHKMSCNDPHHIHDSDVALLDFLTAPTPPTVKGAFSRRDAALDPLLLAAAAASGPNVTRNHYHHDFFPGVMMPQMEGSYDWTKWSGEDAATTQERRRLTYVSRQAPRRQRLALESGKENQLPVAPLKSADDVLSPTKRRRSSLVASVEPETAPNSVGAIRSNASAVEVKCMARTRIPTPHGAVFLHLYHNNRDNKEHLAFVIDPAQFAECSYAPPIRSRSLDAVWSESETEMDRITRGAYVGRLTPTSRTASSSPSHRPPLPSNLTPAPLIRIHSECFTGETIGSMRCDCGEQLDEAMRLISQPITIPPTSSIASTTIPGRGVVIYLRQEGRGIGLLSKIRAYNLQDLGHDTVAANLMLGHKADERGYEIAGAILRDLGMGSEQGEGVKVLTNNPDKVMALEKERLKVVERVAMIPRSWQSRHKRQLERQSLALPKATVNGRPWQSRKNDEMDQVVGATLIGGGAVHGEDLDKYLKTKVLRMGHMLPLWLEDTVEI
jgi:GTP cyclohydrolase II